MPRTAQQSLNFRALPQTQGAWRSIFFGGVSAIRAATLRHVRAPTTALPAQRGNTTLDEFDRAQASGQVVGDANRNRCTPFIYRDKSYHS